MRLPLCTLLTAALLCTQASAATLYDAGAGTLPSVQGWTSLQLGPAPLQSVSGGLYKLDTTAASYFGNTLAGSPVLDTAAGFDLVFTLRLQSETHIGLNRSGYSVVMIGSDPTHGLELGFWSGEVFAYDYNGADPDRFVHGAGAAFDTTAALVNYTLSVRNQQFSFSANGTPLLAGSLRNYTAGGPPYTTPNFLFFGDDSSRGTSISELAFVSLTPVPEPAPVLLLAAGMAALLGRRAGFGTHHKN